MPAELADLATIKAFLGVTVGTDDTLLQGLADDLETLLERETGRNYTVAGAVTAESANGSGRGWVYSARPITTLTSVKIGQDPTAPDETLTIVPTVVVVDPRSPRRIVRTDGGIFARGTANVQLAYAAAANQPLDAKLALLEGVALIYRRRGSEDAVQEHTGMFGHELIQDLKQLPTWKAVLNKTALPSIL